jgi:hypothetical protein
MSHSIGTSEPTFSLPQRPHLFGLCAVVTLVATCSFDAGKLRAPQARDAAQSPGLDAASAGDDTHATQSDAGDAVGMPDVGADLPGAGDVALPADMTIESGVSDAQDACNGADGFDDSGSTGSQGGAGGTGDGGAGGTGGTVDGETDGGLDNQDSMTDTWPIGGSAADEAGTGGVGGQSGDDAAVGADSAATDSGMTDVPVSVDTALDSKADEVAPPTLDTDLVLWYRFDESNGTTASDSAKWGGVARDATLATVGYGSATFSAAKQVGSHALALSSMNSFGYSGGYAVLRSLQTLAPDAITIAVWVNLSGPVVNLSWARIVDCADSSTSPNWWNLVVRNGSSPFGPLFAMSNVGHAAADEQQLIGPTALTANAWHHIAVVLPAGSTYTGVMYVDGVVAATNNAMTLHLSDIGATANNWLGRSEFANDPYFSGSMDDFRVYGRALSQSEIVALMAIK